jgi:transcriptional regulator GlxA family with amidase domain
VHSALRALKGTAGGSKQGPGGGDGQAGAPLRVVAMVGFPGFQILDVTGPLEVFSRASRLLMEQGTTDRDVYRVRFAAREAGPVRSSSGLELVADCAWRDLPEVDTLLVSGGAGTRDAMHDEELMAWLVARAPLARRFGSVCTGAMLLAQAGLLVHRRVTTHWAFLDQLIALAPAARVMADAIFARDDRLWTSAGVTAGMDMALAMIEEDWGRRLSLEVAQQLVMHLKRGGSSPQLSRSLEAESRALETRFANLAAWMAGHLDEELSVPQLAARMEMSPRHFARAFGEELGVTPAKYVEQQRFDAAAELLSAGEQSVERIAELCGFGSAETMRRVFVRRAGIGPAEYRRRLQRDGAVNPDPRGRL